MISRLKTRTHVILYALAVTTLAVGAVELLVIALYPPELAKIVLWRAPVTTVLIMLPLMYVLGMKMRENVRLMDELKTMVNTDRLTGISSREYFFAEMAARDDRPGVIVMADIDDFKQINDTYGHLVGDEVISAVAGLIRHAARGSDVVCRLGGEEFILFLDGVERSEAARVAERMRRKVGERALLAHGVDVDVTVSLGLAGRMPGEALQETIRRADEALYAAKKQGRNRVVTRWVSNACASDDRVAAALPELISGETAHG